MLSTVLSALQMLVIHLIRTTTLRGPYWHHLHFTNKKAKHREVTWVPQGCTEAVVSLGYLSRAALVPGQSGAAALTTEFFELSLKAFFIPLILEKAGLVWEMRGCIQVKWSRHGDYCIEIAGEHGTINSFSVISLRKNE